MVLAAVVVVLVGIVVHGSLGQPNNVCPTFNDYYTIKNNSNCWYDFSAEYKAADIIRLNGYTVVEYKIFTADGYILTIFRIPSDNVRNPKAKDHPIYLQHGLAGTCANFLGNRRNSLAFVLADAGYDVWLGNFRGNEYSEGHVNLTANDQKYWDHSLDEVVLYDYPAIFNTMLKHTGANNKIIYIGHSLGTTLGLMFAAEFPEVAKNIFRIMVFMSPAYTLANMISPYKSAAPFGRTILSTVESYKLLRVVSQGEALQNVVRPICLESPEMMRLCFQMYNLFYGPNTQMGPEIVPVYFRQIPGGTSMKILAHAADLVLGNFRKYDYGSLNKERYGSSYPPEYDIKKINVQIYMVYSTQDWTTTEKDAWNLYYSLPEEVRYGIRKIDLPKFNHIDFVLGRHARRIVYDPLVKVLNKAIDS